MSPRSIAVTVVAAAAVLAVGGGTALALGAGADRSTGPVPVASSGPAPASPTTAPPLPLPSPVEELPAGAPAVDRPNAERIALQATGGGVITSIELDYRDDRGGPPHWEIDIRNGGVEHEVDVDARTGAVLKHDIDDQHDGDDDHGGHDD